MSAVYLHKRFVLRPRDLMRPQCLVAFVHKTAASFKAALRSLAEPMLPVHQQESGLLRLRALYSWIRQRTRLRHPALAFAQPRGKVAAPWDAESSPLLVIYATVAMTPAMAAPQRFF